MLVLFSCGLFSLFFFSFVCVCVFFHFAYLSRGFIKQYGQLCFSFLTLRMLKGYDCLEFSSEWCFFVLGSVILSMKSALL